MRSGPWRAWDRWRKVSEVAHPTAKHSPTSNSKKFNFLRSSSVFDMEQSSKDTELSPAKVEHLREEISTLRQQLEEKEELLQGLAFKGQLNFGQTCDATTQTF